MSLFLNPLESASFWSVQAISQRKLSPKSSTVKAGILVVLWGVCALGSKLASQRERVV